MNIGAAGLTETLVPTARPHDISIPFVNGSAADVSMSLFSDYPVTRRRTSEEMKLRLHPSGNLKTHITHLYGAEDKLESAIRSSGAI